jgi:hypothetical protein
MVNRKLKEEISIRKERHYLYHYSQQDLYREEQIGVTTRHYSTQYAVPGTQLLILRHYTVRRGGDRRSCVLVAFY